LRHYRKLKAAGIDVYTFTDDIAASWYALRIFSFLFSSTALLLAATEAAVAPIVAPPMIAIIISWMKIFSFRGME
jgi:hypothetical protein